MPHLLKPIATIRTIEEAYHAIDSAHLYLVVHAKKALSNIEVLDSSEKDWGINFKRLQVVFPSETRPELIDPQIREHPLSEIMNQSATLARLLDALSWAKQNLVDYHVVLCHPTTSSTQANEMDNDIILKNAAGHRARFEVSDVVSAKDSNGKEKKDLASLGILDKETHQPQEKWLDSRSSQDRLFLVVSPELATSLRKRKKTVYRYEEYPTSESTVIFEVLFR
jgi:hypothetical protein